MNVSVYSYSSCRYNVANQWSACINQNARTGSSVYAVLWHLFVYKSDKYKHINLLKQK